MFFPESATKPTDNNTSSAEPASNKVQPCRPTLGNLLSCGVRAYTYACHHDDDAHCTALLCTSVCCVRFFFTYSSIGCCINSRLPFYSEVQGSFHINSINNINYQMVRIFTDIAYFVLGAQSMQPTRAAEMHTVLQPLCCNVTALPPNRMSGQHAVLWCLTRTHATMMIYYTALCISMLAVFCSSSRRLPFRPEI